MSCDSIKISNPFIIYGKNYTGQVISTIVTVDGSTVELDSSVAGSELFSISYLSDADCYVIKLNKCALINASLCGCPSNNLYLIVKDASGNETKCVEPIYTVIPGYLKNAVSQAGTFGSSANMTLNFNMLPIMDSSGNTPCEVGYDADTAALDSGSFHVMIQRNSEKTSAEGSSFDTRFCQMILNSIKLLPKYSADEMFSVGDELTLKFKTGVDSYGNDVYISVSKTIAAGYTSSIPIKVIHVQKDNTLTLNAPVNLSGTPLTIDRCNNEFIVEVNRARCTEVIPYGSSDSYASSPTYKVSGNQITITPYAGVYPLDASGNEICGTSHLVISGNGCDGADTEHGPNFSISFPIIRYVYDGSYVDGKYTSGTQCIYSTPITLNYDTTDSTGNYDSNGIYGADMYVKLKSSDSCCNMRYISVITKYNEHLDYRHGLMTLNGISLLDGDIVWLASQYSKTSDDGGDVADENGLWTVRANADWEYRSEVTADTFIDLGARVTDTVSLMADDTVGRKYGNYWYGSTYLKSGMIINLQNQGDGTKNGLYRVECGDWEYLGESGPYSGTSIDSSRSIVTYNDIDFCTCGIYHIWYYYLNESCTLNRASRTVKIVGKCGARDGSLVPGKQIKITDYYIKTEVDSELMPGKIGNSLMDSCVKVTDTFDSQYRFDIEDISEKCTSGLVFPDCSEGTVCDHTYKAFANSEDSKYSSSDYSGFSLVFWKAEMDESGIVGSWTMYGLVADLSKAKKTYAAYRLRQIGYANTDMVDVTDWFTASSETAVSLYSVSVSAKYVTFIYPESPVLDSISIGDSINISDEKTISTVLTGKVERITIDSSGKMITVAVDIPGDFDYSGAKALLYKHDFIVDGMIISDPSWVFSGSDTYMIKVDQTTALTGTMKAGAIPESSEYGKYYAYSDSDWIRPIPMIVDASGNVTFQHMALSSASEKLAYVKVTVGNDLKWDNISESWNVKSNTTSIYIPLSYDFRFYSTAISVDEFADIYNSSTNQCVYPMDGEFVIADDDYPSITEYTVQALTQDGHVYVVSDDSEVTDDTGVSNPVSGTDYYEGVASDAYLSESYQ